MAGTFQFAAETMWLSTRQYADFIFLAAVKMNLNGPAGFGVNLDFLGLYHLSANSL